jgi:hypothetical protein
MVDELLTDYPVLNESTQENSTGQIEHLNSLNSTESILTLLALNALEILVEDRDSQNAILSIKSNCHSKLYGPAIVSRTWSDSIRQPIYFIYK